MKISDVGLVMEINRFNEDGDYIQIGDRPTGKIFRGGYMTAAILRSCGGRRINYITSQGEVVYAAEHKEKHNESKTT